jgi:ATP-dependent Clp protease ATP-binding subunit ClpC
MYERFTENSRKAVTLAKLEAEETGSPAIETHHLLQGLITADRDLIQSALGNFSRDAIQEQLLRKRRSATIGSTSADLPLSAECKRVVAFAEEEANKHGDAQVGGQHLLLGLMREPKGIAAQLLRENVRPNEIRKQLGFEPIQESAGGFFQKLKKSFGN